MYDGTISEPQVKARVGEVLRVVARASDLTVDDLRAACRKREWSRPRQIAAYLCRELTDCSYPRIGQQMGDRDHTTILFAHRKVVGMLGDGRPGLADLVARLSAQIMVEAAARHKREDAMRIAAPVSALRKKMFEAKSGPTRWTPEQLQQLRIFTRQRVPRKLIAARLKRSMCAVAHKVAEMNREGGDITSWMERAA